MTERAKKPQGWYGKAAKAERKAVRDRKAAERAKIKSAAERTRKLRQAAAEREKTFADAIGARVQRKAADGRLVAERRDVHYRRQARALRKELREFKVDGSGGTPHTRRQRRDSGMKSMMDSDLITSEMESAAQEIGRVFSAITIGMRLGAASLEPRSAGHRGPMVDKLAWAHASRYRPWADELSRDFKRGGVPALAITIAIVIDDMTLTQAERDFRMRRRAIQFWVCRSLIRYAEYMILPAADRSAPGRLVAEVEREWGMGLKPSRLAA